MPNKTQLKDPADVRRLICKTIRKIEAAGDESVCQNAGKIAQLTAQFLKAYEVEKIADIDRRLKKMEADNANNRQH